MSNELSLWSRSAPWRFTLILTVLATSIVLLVGPWRTPRQSDQTLAQYTPPKQQNNAQSQILSSQLKNAKPLPSSSLSQPTSGVSSSDATFDVAISQTANTFPSGTELHVIGIYEGEPPQGQVDKPWWSKCPPGNEQSAMLECHQKYAGQHTQYTVTVNISRTAPIVLALMSYDPVKWNIVMSRGVNIQKVILSGYHRQDITGISSRTPVDVYTYDTSPCTNCTRQSGAFYAYDKNSKEYTKATQKLETITGLKPSSFQGSYKSNLFSISSNINLQNSNWRNIQAQKSTTDYINKNFFDSVDIANKSIPLPEGEWRGIAYEKLSSNRGSDELLVLARIENNRLRELMTARVQVPNDGKGFSSHSSCKNKTVYTSVTKANEPFENQLCYWVEHNTAPWQQPIFDLTAAKLTDIGLSLPNTVINAGFHRADANSSETILYYTNPEFSNIKTSKTSFSSSLWHPNRISHDPIRDNYVADYVKWAGTWFQLLNAMKETLPATKNIQPQTKVINTNPNPSTLNNNALKSISNTVSIEPDNFKMPNQVSEIPYTFVMTSSMNGSQPSDRLSKIQIDGFKQKKVYFYTNLMGIKAGKNYNYRIRVLDGEGQLVFDNIKQLNTKSSSLWFVATISPQVNVYASGTWTIQGLLNGETLYEKKRQVIY